MEKLKKKVKKKINFFLKISLNLRIRDKLIFCLTGSIGWAPKPRAALSTCSSVAAKARRFAISSGVNAGSGYVWPAGTPTGSIPATGRTLIPRKSSFSSDKSSPYTSMSGVATMYTSWCTCSSTKRSCQRGAPGTSYRTKTCLVTNAMSPCSHLRQLWLRKQPTFSQRRGREIFGWRNGVTDPSRLTTTPVANPNDSSKPAKTKG